jgi:hypothetical protein
MKAGILNTIYVCVPFFRFEERENDRFTKSEGKKRGCKVGVEEEGYGLWLRSYATIFLKDICSADYIFVIGTFLLIRFAPISFFKATFYELNFE